MKDEKDKDIKPKDGSENPKQREEHALEQALKQAFEQNIPDISPETAEILKDLPEEKKDAILDMMIRVDSFSGPLPRPDILEGYEKVKNGAAERIFDYTENEQKHRHKMGKFDAITDRIKYFSGQIIGAILAVIMTYVAYVLGLNGHDWLAGIIFTTTIISVLIIYVLNKKPEQK